MTTTTLQSQEYTTSGPYTFNVPASVTSVLVTMIGAGSGGGDMINGANQGSSGGGGGEFGMKVPLKVVGGGTVSVTVGAKGASVTDGGATIVGSLQALGGHHGLREGPNTLPGANGGGLGGAIYNPATAGIAGRLEDNYFFGGSCGGGRAGSSNGFAGGGNCGHPIGGAGGTLASGWGGGGGGAGSPWGAGGVGGNGLSNGGNAPSTSYGAGGGGAGAGTTSSGGTGADGYVLIQWVA